MGEAKSMYKKLQSNTERQNQRVVELLF